MPSYAFRESEKWNREPVGDVSDAALSEWAARVTLIDAVVDVERAPIGKWVMRLDVLGDDGRWFQESALIGGSPGEAPQLIAWAVGKMIARVEKELQIKLPVVRYGWVWNPLQTAS